MTQDAQRLCIETETKTGDLATAPTTPLHHHHCRRRHHQGRSVLFPSCDMLLTQVRWIESRQEMDPEMKQALYASAEDLQRWRVVNTSTVRKVQKYWGGDFQQLECGGRGLETLQSREHCEQAKMLSSFVKTGVLQEQERQRTSSDGAASPASAGGDEEIRKASEFYSEWSRIKAKQLGCGDEEFVWKMLQAETASSFSDLQHQYPSLWKSRLALTQNENNNNSSSNTRQQERQ